MRFFTLFLLLLGVRSFAQYSPEFYTYREKYPNAHFVRLNQETNVSLKLKNDALEIVQEITREDLYLDEAATAGGSKESVDFSSFFQLEDIEASSFVYDGRTYKELEVENFKKKDELENSFYDDSQTLNFIYPNLEKGSKSKLVYSEKIKNPRFLSPFFFGDFFPVVNNKFTITADKDIHLKFKVFNADSLDIAYSEEERWGNRIYTWELKNINEYDYEEGAPNYKKILPHIIPILTSYEVNGKEVKLLENEGELYNWYYSLVKDLNAEAPSEELVKLVEELTRDKKNNLEKVRAIYYWTQQNIKYIDYEYALGGFIPREGNSVFQKKYGDCKDNSSILHEMLKIAGIKGNLTWIGTRSIPYSYREVPTPISDNHMILSYSNQGETYFLDATGRYMPLGLPSSFIQGKEALISDGPDKFRIETVPVIPAEENGIAEVTQLELKGDDLTGKSAAKVSGYTKTDLFQYLETLDTPVKKEEFYNSFFQKGNNKFLIGDFGEQNTFAYDEDFGFNYDFRISDYAKELGDEIYVNLNLNREVAGYKLKKDRKTNVEVEYKKHYDFINSLKVPEGFEVSYLPENFQVSSELFSASITYEEKPGEIVYRHQLSLNFLNLDLQQQKEFNKLIEKVEKAYKEIIVLKKTKQ
ncbi:MAG: DUF3857 domain-containing protein [Salegentibacter sp.]